MVQPSISAIRHGASDRPWRFPSSVWEETGASWSDNVPSNPSTLSTPVPPVSLAPPVRTIVILTLGTYGFSTLVSLKSLNLSLERLPSCVLLDNTKKNLHPAKMRVCLNRQRPALLVVWLLVLLQLLLLLCC